ncbi:MAG: hypothetical protein RMK74_13170, partial [Myxococcales bacterium]|nr:hypothetical protein [Myxococcales bacterium]
MYPKLSRSPRNATSCLALRWGRARVRAEIGEVHAVACDASVASMGPRACARGNGRHGCRTALGWNSFNGA